MKKVFGLVLALVLVAAMAVPAMATSSNGLYDGSSYEADIGVTPNVAISYPGFINLTITPPQPSIELAVDSDHAISIASGADAESNYFSIVNASEAGWSSVSETYVFNGSLLLTAEIESDELDGYTIALSNAGGEWTEEVEGEEYSILLSDGKNMDHMEYSAPTSNSSLGIAYTLTGAKFALDGGREAILAPLTPASTVTFTIVPQEGQVFFTTPD